MAQMLVNGAVLGMICALIALGITLIFSIMNILNFAHGQMYMLGGFIVYNPYGVLRLNYFVALLAAVMALAGVGVPFERLFFRLVFIGMIPSLIVRPQRIMGRPWG